MTNRDLARRIERRIRAIKIIQGDVDAVRGAPPLGEVLSRNLLRRIAQEAADEAARSPGEEQRKSEE